MIYLDSNATQPLASDVRSALIRTLGEPVANPSSLHATGRRARELLELARLNVGECCSTRAENVYFCSGGSEANYLALAGALLGSKKGQLITSSVEHPSVLNNAAALCQRQRKEHIVVPVQANGVLDLEQLEDKLTGDVALLSVMAANHETGAIQPFERILELAHNQGALVHIDAAQALGKIPLHFDALGVDLLTISGHKVAGPQGIGALLVKPGTPLVSPCSGGHQERGLRPGTENFLGALGLAAACRSYVPKMLGERDRLAGLREHLNEAITKTTPGAKRITLTGEAALCQTLSITFPEADGEAVVTVLSEHGVAAATGAACSSGQSEPSHVLLAMGIDRAEAKSTVRFSFAPDISVTDMETAAKVIGFAVEEVRASYRPK